jgi:hypothetical protein
MLGFHPQQSLVYARKIELCTQSFYRLLFPLIDAEQGDKGN